MSDNDLIKRGVAREILRDELDDIAAMDEASVDNIVDSIPSAVPQEMSARELLLTEARMIYADEYAYDEYSRLIWNLKLDDAAAYAERWAKEHPEERSEQ